MRESEIPRSDVEGVSSSQVKEEMAHQIEALTTLNDIASNPTLSISEQINRALELGARFLGLELGIVSEIHRNTYRVGWRYAPPETGLEPLQEFDLGQTYCVLALELGDVFAIDHMGDSEYRGHPCYQAFSLESYIGVALEVGGKRYGTLSFSSSIPRDTSFREADRMFIRLLARWIGAAIDRYEGRQRLHKLANQFPGMMFQLQRWPDGRTRFPYCSSGIADIYGLTSEEVERDASAVFAMIHPADRDHVQKTIQASAQQLSVWTAQYRVVRNSGKVIWVESQSTPERCPDGSVIWHGTTHDVTEKKRVEEALRRSEARLRGLFELSPLGIALTDFETGEFIEVNHAMAAMTGYSRNELLTMSAWALTPREYWGQQSTQLAGLKENGRYGPYEKENVRKDGTRFPVLLNGMLIGETEGRKLIWSIIEDISERKRMERMKNEFISTVSHELRTPLTSICGALGLIQGGGVGTLPPSMENMVSVAHKNSERLKYLINDLLDMEKLISGHMALDVKPCDLNQLLSQSVDNVKGYADPFAVRVNLDPPETAPRINVDPQRFEQVMANLLSNAIKFSPREGEVNVSVEERGRHVRVSVRDDGPGIPEGFRNRIFQKFAQADASDSRQKGGTGLGLAITKEVVEKMGGEVGYHSREGEGALFYVEFPRELAAEKESRANE